MKNKELWMETKFVKTKQGYMPSRDIKQLGIGSRFIASIQLKVYEKIIKQHARGLLLDLGCGNVPLYEVYKENVSDNICVDWENTLHKNPYLDYQIDLNDKLPLESEQFDTILATDLLEHIAKPDLLISEMTRLLKPSGKIILTVPFFYWLHEKPHDYFRYTEFALKRFCKNNNLTIVSLQAYGGAREIILDIVAKKLAFSKTASKLHLFFSKLFIHSAFGKKVSSRTSQDFPLGYCLVAQK
jgi:SAM-dependent methyltransferase